MKLSDLRGELKREPPKCRFVSGGKTCSAPGIVRSIEGIQIALCEGHYRARKKSIIARPLKKGPCGYCGDLDGVEYRIEGMPEEMGGTVEYVMLCAKCVEDRVPIGVKATPAEPEEHPAQCERCNGSGSVHDGFNFHTCTECGGTGEIDYHTHATKLGPTSGPIYVDSGAHYHRTGIGATDNVRSEGELHTHRMPDGSITQAAR